VVCKEPKYKHWSDKIGILHCREYHKYHLARFEDGETEKFLKKADDIHKKQRKIIKFLEK